MGVVIKGDNNCLGVGRPQVLMHRNCKFSSLNYFSQFSKLENMNSYKLQNVWDWVCRTLSCW